MTEARQPSPPMSTRPRPDRPSRWVAALLSGAFLAMAVVATLSLVPLPYAVMSPGPVTDTLGTIGGQRIIEVPEEAFHATDGRLFFTTVRVRGGPGERVTAFDVARAALDPSQDVYRAEDLFPRGATREQVSEENAAEMEGSQRVAAAVAERAMGQEVPLSVAVTAVVPDSAAVGLVEEGDVIVSVDGRAADSPSVVREAVRAHRPGDTVTIVVRRGAEELTIHPVLGEREGVASLGIVMTGRYELPVEVAIHTGAIGGPSAGMMFALGIYDLLTPGALPAGEAIAGTGTLADDGRVGPIGGIRQKLVGARDGGASWFLSPADNCPEVVGRVPDGLRVVRVSTFDEALSAVERIATGDPDSLPTCTP